MQCDQLKSPVWCFTAEQVLSIRGIYRLVFVHVMSLQFSMQMTVMNHNSWPPLPVAHSVSASLHLAVFICLEKTFCQLIFTHTVQRNSLANTFLTDHRQDYSGDSELWIRIIQILYTFFTPGSNHREAVIEKCYAEVPRFVPDISRSVGYIFFM